MVTARLSTHVLDTVAGRPAAGIPVELFETGPVPGAGALEGSGSSEGRRIGAGVTDVDGRIPELNDGPIEAREVSLVFSVADYLDAHHGTVFYPTVTVSVRLPDGREHVHIPLLLGSFSYSTYLGS